VKERWEIILSGVGGQGLIAAGTVLGEAATIYENKNATLTSSYGVETRGTFSKSDVIISSDDIYFPEVMDADLILTLAPVAYNRYVKDFNEKPILIYDSDIITEPYEGRANQFGYPVTSLAREIGNVAVANTIAMGIIVKKTGVLKEESVIKALEDNFGSKPKILDLNLKAFRKGLEIGDKKIETRD